LLLGSFRSSSSSHQSYCNFTCPAVLDSKSLNWGASSLLGFFFWPLRDSVMHIVVCVVLCWLRVVCCLALLCGLSSEPHFPFPHSLLDWFRVSFSLKLWRCCWDG
jgi:hypothetical protein